MSTLPISNSLVALLRSGLSQLGYQAEAGTINLEHPAQSQFGDVSTNVAMTWPAPAELATLAPRQRAEQLVTTLNELLTLPQWHELATAITKITVAGPGFINFYWSEHFLMAEIDRVVRQRTPTVLEDSKPKNAIVEFSSPNIAKPFTVGHLRSTIIGDAVARLMKAVGHTVYRDNHVGDWGTQFGKLVYAIKTWGNEDEIASADRPIKKLVELYVQFHQEAEANPALEDEGRAWFAKLEAGDAEARRLWQRCIEWSWQEFDQIYQRLGVSFTENDGRGFGESFFENKMEPIIDELQQKGLLKESEGAKLVFFPDDALPPLMVIKKDGSTLYATRDLATDAFRREHYGADITIINEVGGEQALYFQQLFETEQLLGWFKPGQRVHVKHGHYRLKDSKMSTRKGNVIWLEDILQAAYDKVNSQAQTDLTDDEKWRIAIGAVKWHDLKRESTRDIVFNLDEMVSLQGNSGPYVQYAFVRCYSLLQKAGWQLTAEQPPQKLTSFDASTYSYTQKERELAAQLTKFAEVVEVAAAHYQPHHVCTYLNQLAQLFNSFYTESPILAEGVTPAAQVARLHLVYATAITIQFGLDLIGIDTVERM